MSSDRATTAPQLFEWILAGLSAALVLFILAFLVFEGLTSTGNAPNMLAKAGQPEAVGISFHVPFQVRNEGDASAASVVVEAVILANTPSEQRSEVTLDYVPARSDAEGGFVFTHDPRGSPVQIRVLGYQDP